MDDQEFQSGPDLDDVIEQEAEMIEPEEPPFGGLITVDVVRKTSERWIITIRRPDPNRILVHRRGDLNGEAFREEIIGRVLEGLALEVGEGTALADELDQFLMEEAAKAAAGNGPAAPTAEVQYEARVDPEHPEATGFYAVGEKSVYRLTNFVARLEEDVILSDFDEPDESRRFGGTIHLAGEESRFEIPYDRYAKDLQPAIYAAAGPRAEFLAPIETIRTAIGRNSQPAVSRRVTSPGWNQDFTKYLFPGGYVDRDGCHLAGGDDDGPAVDLPHSDRARWLGLRSLDAEELLRVKRHILDDLMGINDRDVVSAMLAAVVLPVVMRPSGILPWPLVWFAGLTGSGKSLLACLGECFYGDFGGPSSGRHMSWKSTFVAIQIAGYSFRDAYFLLDDYKPEDVKHGDCSMVLQCYGDRSGRSRGKPDVTLHTTKAIRGLLVCTGEDFPKNTASGLGRSVVIRVPEPERDFDRVDRCQNQCHLYPGWTAAFIAQAIRDDLGRAFRERVDRWKRVYIEQIRGRPNDARLAANHACLAAAFELFAEFMSDVWGEEAAKEAARAFAEEYIASVVLDAAGEVEENTAARVFLGTLSELIEFKRVRIEGVGVIDSDDTREKDKVVGRLFRRVSPIPMSPGDLSDDEPIRVSIRLAMEAVNGHLDRLGRPRLQVSEFALVDQLAALGCLLDPDDVKPITKDHTGERTKKVRVGGRSRNTACIRASAFRCGWSRQGSGEPEVTGSIEPSPTLPFMSPAPASRPAVAGMGSH